MKIVYSLKEFENETFAECKWLAQVVGHPHFQRLRNISQLGNKEFLETSNDPHNRFNHSIGTFAQLQKALNRKSFRKLNLPQQTINKALFLALCHDLGHGPFSHLLDQQILVDFPNIDFCHEKYSVKLAKEILNVTDIDVGSTQDFEDILLNGGENQANEIFHLISNKRFGVDMDRLDYLQRDSKLINFKCDVDFDRVRSSFILKKCPLIPQKDLVLCLKKDYVKDFSGFLNFRKFMFEFAYTDSMKYCFSLFVKKLVKNGNKYFKFVEKMEKIEDFVQLGDFELFNMIRTLEKKNVMTEMISRFKKKEYYHFCSRIIFDGKSKEQCQKTFACIQNTLSSQLGEIEGLYLEDKISNNKDVNLEDTIIYDKANDKFLHWEEYQQETEAVRFVPESMTIALFFCWNREDKSKVIDYLKNLEKSDCSPIQEIIYANEETSKVEGQQ